MSVRVVSTGLTLLAAALLTGCGGDADPACPLATPVASFDILARQSRILVPVGFGSSTVPFILDTGAQTSVLSSEAADKLNFRDISNRERSTGRFIGEGAAGGFMGYPVAVPKVHFANGNLPLGSFMVAPVFGTPLDRAPAYGLLGADIVSNWALDIDRPEQQLNLFDEDHCQVTEPPWSGAVTSEDEVRLASGEYDSLIRFPLEVNGHTLSAILDTGASTSIEGRAAEELGIDRSHDKTVTIHGVGLRASVASIHLFEHVLFGGRDFGPMRMTILPDMEDRNTDILLGEDFLRRHRVFVSYRQHRIFIDPATPAPG